MENIFDDMIKRISKVYKEFGLLAAIFGTILYGVVSIAIFVLKIFLLMWLWNHTLPELFTGVNEITFLQTMILYIFIKIVF
jgi:hypothetical protein